MSRTTAPLLALFSLSFSAFWITSCGNDTEQTCLVGATRLCACPGRFQGAQSCLADGSYTECDCSGPPREGNGGAGGATEAISYIARACTQDSECGPGLECYASDSNEYLGGGPAGGYCSVACTGDTQCTSIDPQSACVVPEGASAGLCLRTCRSLDPRSIAENKCLGRRDLVCSSVAYLGLENFTGLRQPGWCTPQCGSDEDCGDRLCDLARGLCTDTPPVGAPIGARCEIDEDCAGRFCLPQSEDERFCSAPCVLGQPVGCGFGPSASQRDAACVVPAIRGLLGGAEGQGDVGVCLELCDQSSDCEQFSSRGWTCEASAAAQPFGRVGLCYRPEDAADAGAGSDGGVDAGGGSGGAGPVDASISDAG